MTADVVEDYRRFYAVRRLGRLAIAATAGGVIANSDLDEEIRDYYQSDLRSPSSDRWAAEVDALGDESVVPLFLLAGLVAEVGPRQPATGAPAIWLRRSARAYVAGGPMLLYSQQLIGGSRPGTEEGSRWHPFVGHKGVSGHAFLGAVPLLTLARLERVPRPLRWAGFALSLLPAWGRLNDDQHYFSQSALGWALAWEATGAIAESDVAREAPRVSVMPLRDGLVVSISWSRSDR